MHPLAVEFTATWSSNATLPPRPSYPQERTSPPCGPGPLSLAGCRLVCAASAGALRIAAISIYQASRCHCYGETGRRLCCSLPIRCQPSPFLSRVDFHIARFEDCSTFTHVAARMLAEPPYSGPSPRCASAKLLPPQAAAPIASGRSSNSLQGGMICIRWVYDTFPRRTEKYRLTRSI